LKLKLHFTAILTFHNEQSNFVFVKTLPEHDDNGAAIWFKTSSNKRFLLIVLVIKETQRQKTKL
jgi:hypothetical protein